MGGCRPGSVHDVGLVRGSGHANHLAQSVQPQPEARHHGSHRRDALRVDTDRFRGVHLPADHQDKRTLRLRAQLVRLGFSSILSSSPVLNVNCLFFLKKRTEVGGFFRKGNCTTPVRSGDPRTSTTTSSWEWRSGTGPTVLAIGRATSR